MKITSKTFMVSFETEVKLGKNDAIELTLQHQAYIHECRDGSIGCDLDLGIDISNVKFLGIEIANEGYKEFKEFKSQLLALGIDLNKLIDEKETELMNDGLEQKLILMFKDRI